MSQDPAERTLPRHVRWGGAGGLRNCPLPHRRDDPRMREARCAHLNFPLIFLILCGADLICASEHALRDLRLVAEARPLGFDYTWTDDGAHRHGHDEDDRAVALGLGIRWGWGLAGSPWQLFAGGEALAVEERYGSGGRRGWLGRGEAGAAWSASNALLVTTGLFGGGGRSSFVMPGGPAGEQTLSGPTVEYGLRLGLRLSLDARWSLGCEAGWLVSREDYRDDGASLTSERSGGMLGLSLGCTLDTRPRSID